MLQLTLKQFLDKHQLNERKLADAIADVVIDREPVSERYLRYIIGNTAPFTASNTQRKPSLVMLGYILKGLQRLLGKPIEITDILTFAREPGYEQSLLPGVEEATPLILDNYAELEQLKYLTLRALRAKGYSEVNRVFTAGSAARSASRKKRVVSSLLTVLLGIPIMLLIYEQTVVRPRLLTARGGIFDFRDRIKASSELSMPTLIGPEGEVDQLDPVLRVTAVPGALGYEFYVENLVSGDGVYTGPLPNNSFPVPAGTLCPETSYAWRVRALGEDGWTSFSSALEFTVVAEAVSDEQEGLLRLSRIKEQPDTPTLIAPLGLATSITPMLEVTADPNVMGYGFYIRDLQTDSVIYNNNFALSSEVRVPDGLLQEGGIYQWNARARNCHYWSAFTPAQVFNVDILGGN